MDEYYNIPPQAPWRNNPQITQALSNAAQFKPKRPRLVLSTLIWRGEPKRWGAPSTGLRATIQEYGRYEEVKVFLEETGWCSELDAHIYKPAEPTAFLYLRQRRRGDPPDDQEWWSGQWGDPDPDPLFFVHLDSMTPYHTTRFKINAGGEDEREDVDAPPFFFHTTQHRDDCDPAGSFLYYYVSLPMPDLKIHDEAIQRRVEADILSIDKEEALRLDEIDPDPTDIKMRKNGVQRRKKEAKHITTEVVLKFDEEDSDESENEDSLKDTRRCRGFRGNWTRELLARVNEQLPEGLGVLEKTLWANIGENHQHASDADFPRANFYGVKVRLDPINGHWDRNTRRGERLVGYEIRATVLEVYIKPDYFSMMERIKTEDLKRRMQKT